MLQVLWLCGLEDAGLLGGRRHLLFVKVAMNEGKVRVGDHGLSFFTPIVRTGMFGLQIFVLQG
jgi:hypothetical protein